MTRRLVLLVACTVVVVLAGRNALAQQAPKPRKPSPRAVHFIKAVRVQLMRHDWKGLLAKADPQHLKTQRKMGMGDAQYLAELFGLHSAGNSIERAGTITLGDLARIRKVAIVSMTADRQGIVTATGYVVLADRVKLKLVMTIRPLGRRYVLFGAVG